MNLEENKYNFKMNASSLEEMYLFHLIAASMTEMKTNHLFSEISNFDACPPQTKLYQCY